MQKGYSVTVIISNPEKEKNIEATSAPANEEVDNWFEICPRVALNAAKLGLVHPETQTNVF